MAIATDAASTAGVPGNATSATWTHVCTGSNLFLWVAIEVTENINAPNVTGVTYAGAALTKAGSITDASGLVGTYAYYKFGPATGSNSIVVSLSALPGSAVGFYCRAQSFTGVDQSGLDQTSNVLTAASSPITTNITTVTANAWIVDAFGVSANSTLPTAVSPQVGAVAPNTTSARNVGLSYHGPIVTPASTSDGWTCATATQLNLVVSVIKPATAAFVFEDDSFQVGLPTPLDNPISVWG
jgi:hypothetical protein